MATDNQPVYIILGATGGIGSAVTHRLSDDGAQLVLGARTEEDLNELAEEVGGDPHPLDATDFDDVQDIVDYTTDRYDRFDGIVNLVGSILLKPAHLTSIEEFRETIALNLDSAFYTVKAAARPLMRSGGSIVLSASAVARTGLTNHEAISSAKAGVIGLTQSAAATYAKRDVHVNCVAPGLVDSRMSSRILSTEQGRKQSEAMHALGRVGQPDDVADAICWLLDTNTDWVTGQVIGVDGGLATVQN